MVVFGGFSAEALAGRIQDCRAKVLITADGGYRRGKTSFPLKDNADSAVPSAPRSRTWSSIAGPDCEIDWSHGRDHWWHELEAECVDRLPPRAAGQRASAVHPLHLGHHRQAQGHPAHHRRLSAGRPHDHASGSSISRGRHLLVHGRYRLGHRPHLRRLRSARSRARRASCTKGAPNWPDDGAVLEDHREPRGQRSSTPRRPPSAPS